MTQPLLFTFGTVRFYDSGCYGFSRKQKKRKKEDDSDEENETAPKKRRTKYKRDKTKDKRTVFIGNLPLDAKKSVELFVTDSAV